ncbi:hypothetical protein QJS10_CPB04g00189 [Acorus calamus]|uniref:glycerophosphodiester phosphodiesterase n=1 Tax=Acorus calamus TaxID=4465 RepID=A0AAV9EXE7_ACOCL|nr:hypothetical protein QJS10_CPB04g00189 [Acorus calamus]
MALKAVHVSDVPNLDHVPQTSLSVPPSRLFRGGSRNSRFTVIGHRGKGMNALSSSDRRMKSVKENSILSFNEAGRFGVDFVEFDVQVTRDDCPVIFHDNFILAQEEGGITEKRVTELTLAEFFSYGPQREAGKIGKTMLRKAKDGRVYNWTVEADDSLCTLQEAFHKVDPRLGFNIELKFDDNMVYPEDELTHVLQVILRVVFECAKDRPIIFSSFQPDAAQLVRKLQNTYPVFFLTNGGNEIYSDVRRNSLDEAMKICVTSGLQGIVSEVRGIFRSPAMIQRIKEANLNLLTYGQLNNVTEAVYMQHLMGIDGVIVDLVEEITEAVSDFNKPVMDAEDGLLDSGSMKVTTRPKFSERELSFLLKLIPELIQH